MASEGPRSPGTAGNDATVGSIDWSNPNNILASDDARATVGGNNTSRYLTATNFGFALQVGTTDGITGEAELSKVNGGSESAIRLIVGGTISGNNKSTGAVLSDTDTYHVYGGAADTWGVALTPADVNASTFGMGVSTVGIGASANRRCDHIRMTHHYTAVATSSPKAVMFFSLLFTLIRFCMCRSWSEPFIRFLLNTVIPSEKRSETCSVRAIPIHKLA